MGIPGLPADTVIDMVSDRIAISTGSACSSESAAPSRVLLALGLDREIAMTGVRISLGRFTDNAEINTAINALSVVAAMASET